MVKDLTGINRESLLHMAQLAEQAERYDEMIEYVRAVANMPEELTNEERNLLSVAYKNSVGARRSSWRVVSTVEAREADKKEHAAACANYRIVIEEELHKICSGVLELINTVLLPKSGSSESRVFFLKMTGDYSRYIAEFSVGEARDRASADAEEAYKSASDIAKDDLTVTHPIRLGLALNFSVFHYEVLNNWDTACVMAQQAFADAVSELDNLEEEAYKDSTLIMQLLRDNLTLWTAEPEEAGQNDAPTSASKDEKQG